MTNPASKGETPIRLAEAGRAIEFSVAAVAGGWRVVTSEDMEAALDRVERGEGDQVEVIALIVVRELMQFHRSDDVDRWPAPQPPRRIDINIAATPIGAEAWLSEDPAPLEERAALGEADQVEMAALTAIRALQRLARPRVVH